MSLGRQGIHVTGEGSNNGEIWFVDIFHVTCHFGYLNLSGTKPLQSLELAASHTISPCAEC